MSELENQEAQPEVTPEQGLLSNDLETVQDPIIEDDGRPQGIPDNAWDPETKQVKSEVLTEEFQKASKIAADLRRKLSQKGTSKPPAEGTDYTLPQFEEGSAEAEVINDDDPLVQHFREAAKEGQLSQDQFETVLKSVGKWAADNRDNPPEMTEEQLQEWRASEMAKIGPNAERLIGTVEAWRNRLFQGGAISQELANQITIAAGSAGGLELLNFFRTQMGGEDIPMDSTATDGLPSDNEIYQMFGSDQYKTDPAFREKVDKLLELRTRAGRPDRLKVD